MLKSGGPEMTVEYIFSGEGTREKAAALRGFQEGDMVCTWEMITIKDEQETRKLMRETFKAATLKNADGTAMD